MALLVIASKRATSLAYLCRKLAFKEARTIEASSVQATRLFNTNRMRVPDASDDESTLNRRSDGRVSRPRNSVNGVFDGFNPIWSLTDVLNLDLGDNFSTAGRVPAATSPAVRRGFHAKEDENGLHLRVDMPGLGKEHVKVSAEQNTLIIKGEGEKENGEEDENSVWWHSIDLPDDGYKMNEIKAEMKNGVLKIFLPRNCSWLRLNNFGWDVIEVKIE